MSDQKKLTATPSELEIAARRWMEARDRADAAETELKNAQRSADELKKLAESREAELRAKVGSGTKVIVIGNRAVVADANKSAVIGNVAQ